MGGRRAWPLIWGSVSTAVGTFVGTFVGTALTKVDAMIDPWAVRVNIDARDSDMVRVRPSPFGSGPQIHLAVRTGPLLVFCLDSAAVESIASAWAFAAASSSQHLPLIAESRTRVAGGASPGLGEAWPVTDVVAEGRQRWDVRPAAPSQPYVVVTTDWLQVRVHDAPALETYTQAWSAACALGQQIFRNPPSTFERLTRAAESAEVMRQSRLFPQDPSRPGRDR